MKKLLAILSIAVVANAHFLTMLPSTDNVKSQKEADLKIESMFIHPFEQTGMQMVKPEGIYVNSKQNRLKLKQIEKFNKKAWKTSYKIKRPGVYKFLLFQNHILNQVKESLFHMYQKL